MTSALVKQTLVAASLITVGTNVLGRVFGYAREAAIAGYFGTSAAFDTFLLAFTVPEFISFIAFAALPPALIPLIRKDSPNLAGGRFRLFWEGLIGFASVFGLISILVYSFRENILWWLAPNMTEQQRAVGERLMTILSWFVFFRGVEAFFRSCLYDRKHFVVPATSPIIANLVILILIFSLSDTLDIEVLAYGWLLASMALFLYNGVFAFLLVKPPAFSKVHLASVKPLLTATATIAVIECIVLIYPVIDRYLAAKYLGEGQIAALRYATFLAHIPTGMFAAAFAMASFPWISDLSVPEQVERLKKLYQDSIGLVVFVIGLVASAMVIFSTEIVRVAFQRGLFDMKSLHLTSSPFMFFALGIVFYSVYIFQMRFYYASRALLRVGVILLSMLLTKTILSLVLVRFMEQDGLALATSITWFCGFVIMTVDLGQTLRLPIRNLLLGSVPKILVCVAGVTLFWVIMARIWPATETKPLLGSFIRLALLAFSGAVIYSGLASLLKLPEAKKVYESLRSRLRF